MFVIPDRADFGVISVFRAQDPIVFQFGFQNPTDTDVVRMDAEVLQQIIPGIEVVLMPPEGGSGIPSKTTKIFEVKLEPYENSLIVPGYYEVQTYWTPYTAEGVGDSGTITMCFEIVDAFYEVEFLERNNHPHIDSQTEGLIGGISSNGRYLNDLGVPLTEVMTAGIPSHYAKRGLAADGNTRLMMRITSYLDDVGQRSPSVRFLCRCNPYVGEINGHAN